MLLCSADCSIVYACIHGIVPRMGMVLCVQGIKVAVKDLHVTSINLADKEILTEVLYVSLQHCL